MRLRIEASQPEIDAECFERLDRALVDALAREGIECSRSRLARAFADGAVTIGGRVAKPSRIVDRPLEVDVELAPIPALVRAFAEPLPLAVIFEDEEVVVVDKPAGMVVHASAGHPTGTLVNAILHHLCVEAEALPLLPGNGPERPGIVHRLDRETSGLLVVAKTPRAQRVLAAQFAGHTIERAYIGVVEGAPRWRERRLDTLHGRDPSDRLRFAVRADEGRRAVTNLTTLAGAGRELRGASLLRFVLETGRTHQIRVHARHVGHPILGDRLYGRVPADPSLAAHVARLSRHALHAARLGFEHPDGQRKRFFAPLPAELAELVRALAGDPHAIDDRERT